MKKLLSFVPFIILLNSCQVVESQRVSEAQRKEQAFQELIKKIEVTKQESIQSQDFATKQEAKIVESTVNKIVNLKEEVKNLKTELNEQYEKLNAFNIDTGSKFNLLPISHN